MNITLTNLNSTIRLVVPVVPETVDISYGTSNENYDTTRGKIRLINFPVLRIVAWSSIFPVNKNYEFIARGSLDDGAGYVNFLNNAKRNRVPIRVIVTDDNRRRVLNLTVSVDEFSVTYDSVDDIHYTLKLTEFPPNMWQLLGGL